MIGLFDSGLGGLTILRELRGQFPDRQFMYLGDNARAPYGQKTTDQIRQYTKQGVAYLFQQGCHLVILACNTASAHALRYLQREWLPTLPAHPRLLGIIVPTVEFVTGADWRHDSPITSPLHSASLAIGVLATSKTVASQAFPIEIHRRNQSLTVIQQACPNLASLIERGASEDLLTAEVSSCLQQLEAKIGAAYHAVLLGCTHYDLIADLIRRHLPPQVKLYRQPPLVAASLQTYLRRHPLADRSLASDSAVRLMTTGSPAQFSRLASRLLGETIEFEAAALGPV